MKKEFRLYVGSLNEPDSIWYKYVTLEGDPNETDIGDKNRYAVNQLCKYNAIDDPESLDLIFKNESDAIVFKLKFS